MRLLEVYLKNNPIKLAKLQLINSIHFMLSEQLLGNNLGFDEILNTNEFKVPVVPHMTAIKKLQKNFQNENKKARWIWNELADLIPTIIVPDKGQVISYGEWPILIENSQLTATSRPSSQPNNNRIFLAAPWLKEKNRTSYT